MALSENHAETQSDFEKCSLVQVLLNVKTGLKNHLLRFTLRDLSDKQNFKRIKGNKDQDKYS